jgi:uncharacterized protein with PQ loop repeat
VSRDGVSPGKKTASDRWMDRLLGAVSLFTMAMTIPQVWNVWARDSASGVSLSSWSAYLAGALLWLWHGIREKDKNIYLPCIGWILLDAGVVIGVLVHHGR